MCIYISSVANYHIEEVQMYVVILSLLRYYTSSLGNLIVGYILHSLGDVCFHTVSRPIQKITNWLLDTDLLSMEESFDREPMYERKGYRKQSRRQEKPGRRKQIYCLSSK